MVITIRFTDWALFFFVFFCWGVDHWFTTYGLKTFTELYRSELISRSIECFAMFLLLVATSYITFKLYNQSFFLGTLALMYISFIATMSYFWNLLLMAGQLYSATLIALVSFITTVIGAIMVFQINSRLFLPIIPLLLWRLLLFLISAFCLASI